MCLVNLSPQNYEEYTLLFFLKIFESVNLKQRRMQPQSPALQINNRKKKGGIYCWSKILNLQLLDFIAYQPQILTRFGLLYNMVATCYSQDMSTVRLDFDVFLYVIHMRHKLNK